jgi:hypothetical protein
VRQLVRQLVLTNAQPGWGPFLHDFERLLGTLSATELRRARSVWVRPPDDRSEIGPSALGRAFTRVS